MRNLPPLTGWRKTMGIQNKAEMMDTQDGMVAKDAGLTVLEPAEPKAGSVEGQRSQQGMTLAAARAEAA